MSELEPERGAVPDLSAVPLDQLPAVGLEDMVARVLPATTPVKVPFSSSI